MTLDGEHFLGFAHASERMPTHRQQWLLHALRCLRERVGNQDWLSQHFAQSLEARRLIHGGGGKPEDEGGGGGPFVGRGSSPPARGCPPQRPQGAAPLRR